MSQPFKITSQIRLKDFNPGYHDGLDKDETREKTAKACERIGELQQLLYANHSHALIVLFQGMDTSGKDGAGRNLLKFVNPAGVETNNFKAPSAEEMSHDFLWRVHKAVPRYGDIGVFNRSHYEEVLIVRVMNLQPKSVWSARYDQINAFESMLSQNNVILLKFFLHLSKEEQARRLESRLEDKSKNWKMDPSDLKTRKYWDDYQVAYQDVLNKCSTRENPWHLVPADHKWYRDHVISKAVVRALEDLKLKWPKPKEDFSKIRIK